jgi:predicted TIM-barrel fold metal-dependent hydrolase
MVQQTWAAAQGPVDVHQHLWPPGFVEQLRRRTTAPRMCGWTLYLPGEPPYDVCASDHDVAARAARARADAALVLVSLSSPLGLEDLPGDDGAELLRVWHKEAADLPAPFASWAAASRVEPDRIELGRAFDQGFRGLQVPATWLATPQDLESVAELLAVAESHGRPVLVHPGAAPAVPASAPSLPAWWPALVPYVAQMHAAWWTWHVAGRALLPDLRICFAAGAGLAPIQHERLAARGGRLTGPGRPLDPNVFVDTSSYGPQAVDALVRVLGIDALVLGSDRPYADPMTFGLGEAAHRAITCTNPIRLLEGGRP